MAARHLLYFTAEDHYLYRSSGRTLELEAKFTGDDLGVTSFREYLKGHRGALFLVVADLAGEDFHEDQIPFLRGADRENVVQRRLAQRYRDTRLAAALSLGYVAGERRNERLLLASFTNTQQLAPWLDALEEAGAKLEGVYSVPLLAPLLAPRLLGGAAGQCVVVSANRAGLRQCFVDGGKLRFARLERTVEMVPQALAVFVRSETMRLVQYLSTLRAIPRDGPPVQVLVVAPAGQRAVFEQALVSDGRQVFRTVDAADAARAVGLARVPDGALAEALYLRQAAKRPPREQFASRTDRQRYFVWRLQRGVVAAGALGLAACGLFAGYKWLEVMDVRERAALQLRQAQNAAEQYQRITAGFPVTQTSTENVKATVVEFRRLAERTATPEPALMHVSRVLERFPQIELEGLVWSVGRADQELAAKPAAGGTSQKPASGQPPRGDRAVSVEISGRVNATQRNDYRGITAQVREFADALAGGSGYEVVRTRLPFDITSEGTLTGDIGAGADTGEAPRFTVVIARRHP